ncbi:MAG: 30S ribosomal protein S17 [Patescibacteria group bacterium]|nr:30S ribosomal protein S17 [Patescibacteria group bacterium]MDE1944106.1 30S ribosomal protein S17 [Patescibacteria group bacterium]MDE1945039.1 30S ribosomal protein S17 [Patescibacteria group bacterium]MDE2057499.1 30S ribosomal protein S17 [Patescibacteria group bacterium]
MTTDTSRPQTLTGTVVKHAGTNTAVVRVDRYVKHPKYKKYQVRSKKYLVEDAGNAAGVGDLVTIVATRPLSKLKRFKIGETVRKGAGVETPIED